MTFAGHRQSPRRPTDAKRVPPSHVRVGGAADWQERAADRLASGISGIQRPSGPPAIPGPSSALMGALVSGTGKALDPATRGLMESALRYDFGAVRVHNDASAARAARELDARAFTIGNQVVVGEGYEPDTPTGRWMLAHELAHVAMGRGDRSVLRRFTAFTTADQAADKSLGWKHPTSTKLRVADDGKMVVEDKGWGANRGKRVWTTATLMARANTILAAQTSKVALKAKGGSLTGIPPAKPKAAAVTLDEIEPVNAVGGGPLTLTGDCGHACKEVIGSGGPGKDVAVTRNPAGRERYTTARDYYSRRTQPHTTPEDWTEEVFKKEFGSGLTRTEAYDAYSKLTAAEQDAFDKKYGINRYAKPRVGQGLTVSTEVDMPGYADYPGMSAHTWNFHFAATVLTSGGDYVTLENAARWAPTDWIFFMYGPETKAGQTFHEFHGATKTHGTKYTTLVVQPEAVLDRKINRANAPALMPDGSVRRLALGTTLRVVQEFRDEGLLWVQVEVKSGALAGTTMTIQKAFTQ